MKKDQRKRRGGMPASGTDKSVPESESGALSATGLSTVRRQMGEFDDLPPEVRAVLMSANEPSDQMIDVLCTMHRSGFPVEALMKVITASNAKGSS